MIIGMGQFFNRGTDEEKRYALSFDGVDDWVNLGNSNATRPTGPFSLEVRFNLRRWGGLNGWEWIVAKNSSSSPDQGYVIGKTGSGPQGLWLGIRTSGGARSLKTSTVPQLNQDYHAVATINPEEGRLRLYLNGVLEAEQNHEPFSVVHDTTRPLAIGNTRYFGNAVSIDGIVSLFRLYHKELTPEEVAVNYAGQATREGLVAEFLFNEGGGTTVYDYAGGIGNRTINGAQWVEVG